MCTVCTVCTVCTSTLRGAVRDALRDTTHRVSLHALGVSTRLLLRVRCLCSARTTAHTLHVHCRCAEGLLLRGRLAMLAAATAKAEEVASYCVAARLQAEFDNEANDGTTGERDCRRRG